MGEWGRRLRTALAHRVREQRLRRARKQIEELQRSLERLGLATRVPSRVCVVLRKLASAEGLFRWRLVAVGMGWVWSVAWLRMVADEVMKSDSALASIQRSSAAFWAENSALPPIEFGFLSLVYLVQAILITSTLCVMALGPAWWAWRMHQGTFEYWPKRRTEGRYRLVRRCGVAIRLCSGAYLAHGEVKVQQLQLVAVELKVVYREISAAHRTLGVLPTRSHRRPALRQHAGLVIAALRQVERDLDNAPQDSLPRLAEMLLMIADRYSQGLIGRLLDEEYLQDLEPVRDHEPVRMAITAVMLTVVGVSAAFLDLPDAATTYIVGGVGIVLVSLIYGRRGAGLDILDSVRGIQRP